MQIIIITLVYLIMAHNSPYRPPPFFHPFIAHLIFIGAPTTTLQHLRDAAKMYYNLGLSTATRKAYATGIKKYISFCSQAKLRVVPTSEDTLVLFVTYVPSTTKALLCHHSSVSCSSPLFPCYQSGIFYFYYSLNSSYDPSP